MLVEAPAEAAEIPERSLIAAADDLGVRTVWLDDILDEPDRRGWWHRV
jgi:hypothetical protein